MASDTGSHPAGNASTIVVFDGGCGVCTAFKEWASKHVAGDRDVLFLPHQDPALETKAPGVTRAQAEDALTVRLPEGKVVQGAHAAAEILLCLGDPWPLLGHIGRLAPVRVAAEPFYRLFANHRGTVSRWLGLTECEVDPGG